MEDKDRNISKVEVGTGQMRPPGTQTSVMNLVRDKLNCPTFSSNHHLF